MKLLSILVSFLIIVISLTPDINSQNSAEDTLKAEIGEIIVTANKINTSNRNVTQKVDVISSNEIQNLVAGNNNLAELITKAPGASISALSRNDANWGT